MVGNAELRSNLAKLKDAELTERKLFHQNMGNKLFGDNDAVVKHVEYPPKRGRGIKIFIDKLVFTFFF